eukprot:SAG31_NODE_2725_length_5186_cov_4.147435_2_plen_71_part_00
MCVRVCVCVFFFKKKESPISKAGLSQLYLTIYVHLLLLSVSAAGVTSVYAFSTICISPAPRGTGRCGGEY